MAHSHRVFTDRQYAYFVTCTVVDWLPVLTQNHYRQIVLNSLAYLREHKRTQLNAFVIMSTHLHAILWPEDGINLSDVLPGLVHIAGIIWIQRRAFRSPCRTRS